MKWKIRFRPKRESVLSVCQTEMNLVIPRYFWFCFWIWQKLFWLKRDLLSEQNIGCFDYGKANLKELKIILLFLNNYPRITISYQKPLKILCSWGWIFFCFILSFLYHHYKYKGGGTGNSNKLNNLIFLPYVKSYQPSTNNVLCPQNP